MGDRARDRYQEIMNSGKSQTAKTSGVAEITEATSIRRHPAYDEAQGMEVGHLMREINRLDRELNRARHVKYVLSKDRKTELTEKIKAYSAVLRIETNTDPVRVSR